MGKTSIPLLQIRPPKSYSKIASFLLGDEALLDLEMNKKVYKKSSWIIISFLMLLVILIIIFVILYLKCRQKKSS
jgi:ABC-type multidrug transport system permease subunit